MELDEVEEVGYGVSYRVVRDSWKLLEISLTVGGVLGGFKKLLSGTEWL